MVTDLEMLRIRMVRPRNAINQQGFHGLAICFHVEVRTLKQSPTKGNASFSHRIYMKYPHPKRIKFSKTSLSQQCMREIKCWSIPCTLICSMFNDQINISIFN